MYTKVFLDHGTVGVDYHNVLITNTIIRLFRRVNDKFMFIIQVYHFYNEYEIS